MNRIKGSVLWLTPGKPEAVSVGRRRIAECLRERGFRVEMQPARYKVLMIGVKAAQRYDVIIGTTRAGAITGAWLSCLQQLPFIVDHVDPIRQLYETSPWILAESVRKLENFAFRSAEAVLYVYEEESDRVEAHARRAVNTNLGVDYERFSNPNSSDVERARDEFDSLGVNGRIAVYVGGLEPIYHLEELVYASDLLDDWTLVIIGTGSLSGSIGSMADERESVLYLGSISHEQVPGYLANTDVGVSLVDDQHTLKLLEYGAAGLPVVSLEGRARQRFGEHLTYCVLDPSKIASAIDNAYDDGPSASLQHYISDFDWHTIASTYADVIKSVV